MRDTNTSYTYLRLNRTAIAQKQNKTIHKKRERERNKTTHVVRQPHMAVSRKIEYSLPKCFGWQCIEQSAVRGGGLPGVRRGRISRTFPPIRARNGFVELLASLAIGPKWRLYYLWYHAGLVRMSNFGACWCTYCYASLAMLKMDDFGLIVSGFFFVGNVAFCVCLRL